MGTRKPTGPLLQKLRGLMKQTKFTPEPLQAYIVPQKDPHNSEYLAPNYERRAFISGFTGSTGTAVITMTAACLWTDGRYFLQASDELDGNWTLMKEGVVGTPKLEDWLSKELPRGSRVGVDPTLVSVGDWCTWSTELHSRQHSLVPVSTNLVDELWDTRPAPPDSPLIPHPIRYSGKSSHTKITEVRKKMEEKNVSMLIVSALDEVAWLLNLRGSDIPYNPVFFAYVVINSTDINVFIDSRKLTPAIHSHFSEEELNVTIQPYENIVTFLGDVVKKGSSSEKYWIPHLTSYAVASIFPESSRINDESPISAMKALKNPTEVKGLIDAHVRDGAALVCYLAWLEKQLGKGANVTEISGATRLEEFRREQENFVGLSFPTISSSGPHAAVIHYQPSEVTDKQITTDQVYLCDSGAQYKDGTTDITRTVHFGTPTDYQKECFTRVFKGHVALASVAFPAKIKGNCLDTLARHSLWTVGLDYMHGTGHGIGSYLNVHEGPMGISWRPYPDDPGLQEGMFLSNEPGYYEDGQFGIRIENIQRIIPAKTKYQKKKFLSFEVVSLAPIQVKLLEPKLLTKEEIEWLNRYHTEVREKLTPLLLKLGHNDTADWLRRETEPIG
ncbi:xaa-Pro aminopeptidase ApepP isoform X2 [Macrosteles quadrilineatus]|nr:xaa-Pro aminopeptidase ApepP isoform X2 [Macrosteles quadrilineatus]